MELPQRMGNSLLPGPLLIGFPLRTQISRSRLTPAGTAMQPECGACTSHLRLHRTPGPTEHCIHTAHWLINVFWPYFLPLCNSSAYHRTRLTAGTQQMPAKWITKCSYISNVETLRLPTSFNASHYLKENQPLALRFCLSCIQNSPECWFPLFCNLLQGYSHSLLYY